jgi:hypothetical protein
MKNIFYVLVSSLFLIQGCSKNNESIGIKPINTLDTITNFKGILFANEGKLTLNFEHYFKNNPLIYATQNYITIQKDTIQINSLPKSRKLINKEPLKCK